MNIAIRIKSKMIKGLAAVALVASLSAVPAMAGDVVIGGAVPMVNNFTVFGNTGLDVVGAGTAVILATVRINNNTAGGWVLTATIVNGGFLKSDVAIGAAVQGQTLNNFTAVPSMAVNAVPGTIGGTLVPTVFTAFAAGSSGSATSGAQTVATSNYGLDIKGTWAAASTLLAGSYQERITIGLTCTL